MASSVRVPNKDTDNVTDAGNRQIFTMSNGHVLALIRDEGTGGTQHLYVYESANRTDWSLRATIDCWSSISFNSVTGTLGAGDNLSIVALGVGKQDLRYCFVDHSDWSVSGWQQLQLLTGNNEFEDFDVDISDAGDPYVAAVFWNGPGAGYGVRLFCKNSGSWEQVGQDTVHSSTWVEACQSISICVAPPVNYSGSAYDQLFVAFGRSTGSKDTGVGVYRPDIKVSDGSIRVGMAATILGIYAAGESDPKSANHEGRICRWFRNPDNDQEVYLGIAHALVHRRMFAIRFNVPRAQQLLGCTPATFDTTITPANLGGRGMGITCSGNNLVFFFSAASSAFPVKTLLSFVARWSATDDKFEFTPRGTWFLKSGYIGAQSVNIVASGGQRNGNSDLCDILFHTAKSPTNRQVYFESLRLTEYQAPTITYPASGSNIITSTPTFKARIKHSTDYFQSQMSVAYEFAGDSSFTTEVGDIDPQSWVVVDKVNSQTGQAGIVSGTVPPSDSITPGSTIYLRARDVDAFGNNGPWSGAVAFTVSHPPSASDMIPSDGTFISLLTGDKLMFKWTFVDPSDSDSQSAYQLLIIKNSDGSTILDTGKVTSSDNFVLLDFPSGHIDEDISWQVTLWDSYDTIGPASGRSNFRIEVPPVVTITSPTTDEDVGTPVPHVEFSVDTSGDATIKSYRVLITQGRATVWDSGTKLVADPDGTDYTVDGSTTVFHNLGKYSVVVLSSDSRGFQGKSDTVSFSASWTPPEMPTSLPVIDMTHYNTEGEGYVVVTWDDSGKDANFAQYVLQRQANLLDAVGDVAEFGDWEDAATVYDNDTAYEYHDYLAPGTNYQVGYRLVQGATIFNDIVYSDAGPAAYGSAQSDSYWLIDPLLSLGGAYRLFNVTADSYNVEYETETYHVIGRGNHTDYGDRLGYNGSLTAQLRNSGNTTARQKKTSLEDIKELKRPLYMRTPFGDVKFVSVGDLQISRIAGVGIDEFVDVVIPYQEVGG